MKLTSLTTRTILQKRTRNLRQNQATMLLTPSPLKKKKTNRQKKKRKMTNRQKKRKKKTNRQKEKQKQNLGVGPGSR